MQLTIENFFKTILPSQGVYGIAYRDSGSEYVSHKPHYNIEHFLAHARNQDFTPTDYWFALAGYEQGYYHVTLSNGEQKRRFRTQDNAKWLRCLWLDLDVGADKEYATTAEALQALRNFCIKADLNIPTIVYSGSGGLHVYWAFDRDIGKVEWRDLASRLHEATVQLGLPTDPMRTKDCASILRIPGTFNWKSAFPMPVQLQYLAPAQTVEYYAERLAKFEPHTVSTSHHEAGINADIMRAIGQIDFAAMLGGKEIEAPIIPQQTFDTRKATDVVAQCPQLQQQENAPEPVWRGMLATLRHCEDGYEMSHKLSKQDNRYNESDTDSKIAQLEEKDIAPYTCDTFNRLRPEVCAKCLHKGIINSPISVPTSKITTVQIEDDGQVVKSDLTLADLGLAGVSQSTLPVYETDGFRVNETGCFVHIKAKNTDKWWWHKFYDYPVYPIQRVRDRNLTGDVEISYVFRKHHRTGYDDFQVMGETLMGQGINGFLGSVGFLLNSEERKHMAGLMIDLLKEVGSELEETTVMDKLGWSKDMKTFLLGNKLYKTTGQVVEISPKGYAAAYSSKTVPQGSLEQWKKAADIYNRKGLEWGQMTVACAFASPLMPMGSLERAALMFLTGDKGVGKSTALHLYVSVFGDSTELMVNKDDTPLARIAKLGIMSNIAVGFDEMTDLSPQEASALAYQITQGRGKDRMADGGKGIQHNKTFWSCLPVMSANDSIINSLAQHSFDATAQMSRVLEVKATDINAVYSPTEFDQAQMLVRSLPQNYGLAGDVYMRWVTANMDTVNEMIYRTEKLVVERTGLNNNYRFYTYMCTRILVGAMIAKKLGLVSYDTEALFDYLVDVIHKNKKRISTQNTDVNTVLGSFLSEHIGNRIVVTSDVRSEDKPFEPEKGEGNDIGYVIQKPAQGRDLSVRVVRDANIVYISTKAIKDWCIKSGTPYDKFMTSASENAEILHAKKRDYLGKFTQWHDTGRLTCLVLRLNEDNELT